MQLNVSNIQHFSIGDGPGIRTTVFLKGCPLRCPWCHNPETRSTSPVTLTYPSKKVEYGVMKSVEAVYHEICEDLDFYPPDGGATISGGEPMLQAEAVTKLCRMLKNTGVPVIIDTAGDLAWETFVPLLPLVDCWYFDCKTAEDAVYRDCIGADPDRVFQNLKRLSDAGASIQVRIPLIPGVNTAKTQIRAIIQRLSNIGIRAVDLLPFHRMATGKYEAMGISYPYADTPPLTPKQLNEIEEYYRTAFTVTVER